MDLERIKQNLRLRSGRTKKTRKPQTPVQHKTPTETAVPNGVVKQPANPPTKTTLVPRKEDPSLRIWDRNTALPEIPKIDIEEVSHRPSLPHAATGDGVKNPEKKRPTRYGRSGIEVPGVTSIDASPSLQRMMSEPKSFRESDKSDTMDFDLRPPAAKAKPPTVESLSEQLFSSGHLNTLLHLPPSIARFTAFLKKYKPEYLPMILGYLETQKAIKAVEYANAVAEGIKAERNEEGSVLANEIPAAAAILNEQFEESSTSCFKTLVGSALPMYITYRLIKIATECLINEITGRQTPVMRDLVGGLSEVFCITDPNQEDNPIIFASEEFYRFTGYGRDDVIGHNCRFLQGVKTRRESVTRLREGVGKGEETYETLLNYRRDGRPFINLLMIAPLHDDKGKIKYNIGAQVDVSGLVEGGRALESFERFLASRKLRGRRRAGDDELRNKKALDKLRELSEMFDLEESAVVQSHSRASSMSRDEDQRSVGSSERRRVTRRRYIESSESDNSDEQSQIQDKNAWKLGREGSSGLSGKLPGVYDSYMLIRPAPSFRIIFVSPKLQRLGNMLQSRFLAHVAAPEVTLKGLKQSFDAGIPVSAKINFMSGAGEGRNGMKTGPGLKHEDGKHGRACWISATPLLGSDDRIGVWMVVIVEKSKAGQQVKNDRSQNNPSKSESNIDGSKKERPTRISIPKENSFQLTHPDAPILPQEEMPIKPRRLDNFSKPPEKDKSSPVPRNEVVLQDREHEEISTSEVNGQPLTNQDNEPSDDHFVQVRTPSKSLKSPDRIQIQSDSDVKSPSLDNPVTNGQSAIDQDPKPAERKYTPPPEIPAFMRRDPEDFSPSDDAADETPTRSRFDIDDNNNDDDGYDNAADFASPGQDSTRPEVRYMDYLRHPGSRPSAEYTSGQSGSGFNSMRRRQAEDVGGDKQDDHFTDIDCAMSPYSVD